MQVKIGLLFILLAIGSIQVSMAREFPGVQELMTSEEFGAAGLDKLSAEELKALDRWLLRYTTDDVPELVKEVPELKESAALKAAVTPPSQPEPEPERVVSRVQGKFKGWSGKTVFKLENGQVKSGELPVNFWGDMKANYEAHNRDYTGVYQGKEGDCHGSDKD